MEGKRTQFVTLELPVVVPREVAWRVMDALEAAVKTAEEEVAAFIGDGDETRARQVETEAAHLWRMVSYVRGAIGSYLSEAAEHDDYLDDEFAARRMNFFL